MEPSLYLACLEDTYASETSAVEQEQYFGTLSDTQAA